MLNEIAVLEQGLAAAGFSVTPRHPDVQSPGRSDALHVRLASTGLPSEVAFMEAERLTSLWTLRNGNHNSFPYVQLKRPLLDVPNEMNWHELHRKEWDGLNPTERRNKLRELAKNHPVILDDWTTWPGSGLRQSLERRASALARLPAAGECVRSLVQRFLKIDDGAAFADALLDRLLDELGEGDDALLEIVRSVLVGRLDKKGLKGGSLYLDVGRGEFDSDVADTSLAGIVSAAFAESVMDSQKQGLCMLTGKAAPLHAGNFPQPSLPVLGQVYLFAKNGDIPAAYRYRRSDDKSVAVSTVLSQRLAGALDEVTAEHREGQTWRKIPGEKPKQSDLFLAFVDGVPEAPVADTLAFEGGDDLDGNETVDRRAAFLTRTQRLIDAVKAKVGAAFRSTPVTVCVLRKVDTGNSKAILHRSLTVANLYDSALAWARAQENLPDWLSMPVATKTRQVVSVGALHSDPLQLPRATRTCFIREGRERAKREPVGITVQDALTLFLGESGSDRIATATLLLVLKRQGVLLSGAIHARRRDDGFAAPKFSWSLDRSRDALRTASLLSLLLAKLGRSKEEYMNDVAFKLGQLLAVADTVHVGYCIDMRGGNVPPTLLGNSVLATAQSDPVRALSVLCRRWKPYAAWAKRSSPWEMANQLKDSSKKSESRVGWAILKAISHASRADKLARELHGKLPQTADDRFRAELLLGYVAGLPPKERLQAEQPEEQEA